MMIMTSGGSDVRRSVGVFDDDVIRWQLLEETHDVHKNGFLVGIFGE